VTDAQSPETGDRPAPPGSPPILIDMSQQPEVPAPQGDRHLLGAVILVRDDQRPPPTAGEYRAAGYTVPDHDAGPVADDQVPGLVYADRWAPRGTVILPASEAGEPPAEAASEESAEVEVEKSEAPAAEPSDETREEAPPVASPEERAEEAGRLAAEADEPRSANPHDRRTTEGKAWDRGWQSVQPAD